MYLQSLNMRGICIVSNNYYGNFLFFVLGFFGKFGQIDFGFKLRIILEDFCQCSSLKKGVFFEISQGFVMLFDFCVFQGFFCNKI